MCIASGPIKVVIFSVENTKEMRRRIYYWSYRRFRPWTRFIMRCWALDQPPRRLLGQRRIPPTEYKKRKALWVFWTHIAVNMRTNKLRSIHSIGALAAILYADIYLAILSFLSRPALALSRGVVGLRYMHMYVRGATNT